MAAPRDHAPLTAAHVRRAAPPAWLDAPSEATFDIAEELAAWDWRGDLRLFAVTWAAGFVFFLTFIA
jgi:hypothetical protein